MAEFTNAGEFRRGKGGKKSRFGHKTSERALAGKRKLTPDEIALKAIDKEMVKQGVTDRTTYNKILALSDQIRFINPQLMAIAIFFMSELNLDFNGDLETINERVSANISYDSFLALTERVTKGKDVLETGRVDEKLVASMLKYVKHILILIGFYKDTSTDQLEEYE